MNQLAERHGRFLKKAIALLIAGLMVVSAGVGLVADSSTEPGATLENQTIAARLSAGLLHSALINYDGQLYVWGDNTYGQAGIPGEEYYDEPMLIELPDRAVDISLGSYHTLVLLADGTVWAFGRNAFGQIGNGGTQNATRPVRVAGLPKITAISAGSWHALALAEDGSIWAWGNNTDGQLGDITCEVITDSSDQTLGVRCSTPTRIIKEGAQAIAAGGLFSMFLDQDGNVYAWGDNSRGQLGNGSVQATNMPTRVLGLSGVSSIAAGYQHALAVVGRSGHDELYSWGDNSLGQLGTGQGLSADAYSNVPGRVDISGDQLPDNDQIIELKAGYAGSAVIVPAVDEQGNLIFGRQKLLVWGSNASGQLGLGNVTSQNRPVALTWSENGWSGEDFLPFDQLALGGSHMLILSSKGHLAACGRGDRGQLGNLSILDRYTLVAVSFPDVIRPIWIGDARLSAAYNSRGELVVRWPQAQDNLAVTCYRVKLATPLGTVDTVNAGNTLTWTFDTASKRVAYEITVMACDSSSETVGEESLSRLVGYILPSDAGDQATADDFFAEISESSPRVSIVLSNWQPDPKNRIQPLEVPWDTTNLYGEHAAAEPADWTGYRLAGGAAIILLILFGIDLKRRHRKSKARIRSIQ